MSTAAAAARPAQSPDEPSSRHERPRRSARKERRERIARRWELRACGRHGHLTFDPADRPDLRPGLRTSTSHGEAWRCLRCGDFVLGPPRSSGAAAHAPRPLRGAALRDAFILRVLAVERALRALLLLVVAYGIAEFDDAQAALDRLFHEYLPQVKTAAETLGIQLEDTLPLRLAEQALAIPHSSLMLAVGLIAGYGAIVLIEAVGLWSMRRWGEYVAVIATSVFLPYEIYDLVEAVTPLRIATFAVNLAIVVWLVCSKRLFGVRGGVRAFHAARESEAILQVEAASH